MIHLHIEAATPGELHSQLSGLLASVAGGVVPTTTVEAPKKGKATAEAPKPAAPQTAPQTAPPTEAPKLAAPPTAPTDVAGTYIAKIAKVKGKAAAIELLGKFGAKRGQEIKPEDLEKFIAAAKVLVGE